jgi:hypothetical protein
MQREYREHVFVRLRAVRSAACAGQSFLWKLRPSLRPARSGDRSAGDATSAGGVGTARRISAELGASDWSATSELVGAVKPSGVECDAAVRSSRLESSFCRCAAGMES